MKINRNGLILYDDNYEYFNDNDFKCDSVNYEKDKQSNRCYILNTSKNINEHGMIKRRIKKADYDKALEKVKALIV